MSKRFLDWNQETGVASYWLEDGEGGWAEQQFQHTDDLLDLNKEAANHCNPYNADRSVRMVARIPNIIIAKWRNEYGIDYFSQDPDVQRRIDRLLDDPEWRWLRTDYGNATMLTSTPPDPTKKIIL